MLSIGLVKGLVYGALALSLACSLITVTAVILWTARARARRWAWALAAPMGACALVSWIWLYPSFQMGTMVGFALGAMAGGRLPATADAVLMAAGIGFGTYVAFAIPISALAFGLSVAVTSRTPAKEPRSLSLSRSMALSRLWVKAVIRTAHAIMAGAPARIR